MRELIAGSGGAGAAGPRLPRAVTPSLDHAAEALGAVVEMAPDGPCLVVRRSYAAGEQYGRRRVGEYPRPRPAPLSVVGGVPRVLDASGPRTVYFDLETTGLSGGAGTVAFLVGFGWFEGGAFRTVQYLLPTLAAESRLLRRVAELLESAATLVTFNGKSFDVPITDARFALYRLRSPLGRLTHVDLLHPARRLWSESQTRLVGLERAVLGVRREGDVPGGEIPARYVAYLRGGDPEMLTDVLEHNRLDLVSLGLLTGVACTLVETGVAAATGAAQALGLGRLYEKAGQRRDAECCYRAAAHRSAPSATRAEALRRLALAARRGRQYAEAATHWQELLSIPGLPSALAHEAHVALAVYHEHRSRDLQLAERLATGALARERQPRRRQALEHRVRRLTRKLEQQQGPVDSSADLLPVPSER